MSEWYETEDFWIELYPYMFSEERFESAPDQVDQILALLDPPGKHVLDLCCGPGRHAIEFAKREYIVTGVDLSNFLLNKAKTFAKEQNAQVEWVQQDMRHFLRPETFDIVINMFTAFGYFDNKDEDLQVLRNIHQSLKSGGQVLIDVKGKEDIASGFHDTHSSLETDGTRIIQCHEIFDNWTRIRNEWILIRDGQTKSFKFHHTIYSGQELIDRLALAGFQNITLYGDLDGTPYGVASRRLIATAQKIK